MYGIKIKNKNSGWWFKGGEYETKELARETLQKELEQEDVIEGQVIKTIMSYKVVEHISKGDK